MPKRRKQFANVAMDQNLVLTDDGEVLLENYHTMATSSARTLKAIPERDLSFRFYNAFDEPPWAIMKRANRWKAKTAAVELRQSVRAVYYKTFEQSFPDSAA